MNTELKQKWVEALESGKYNQIQGQLKNSRGYCCLGVLCEVANIPISLGGTVCLNSEGKDESYWPLRNLGLDPSIIGELYKLNDSEER